MFKTKKEHYLSWFKTVWSYAPITDQNGQPTGYCRIYYRIRIIPISICTTEVAECIAEKLCKELNS